MTNIAQGHMIDIITAMESPLLRVQKDRCVLVRHRKGSCLRCAEVCTTGAISAEEGNISVNPSLCIGCGTCASACPTGALVAQSPSDERLFSLIEASMQKHDGRVAIACGTALGSSADESQLIDNDLPVIDVVCLGRIDESVMVQASAQGAREILLISGSCETCIHHCGGALAAEMRQSADSILDAYEFRNPIRHLEVKDIRSRLSVCDVLPFPSQEQIVEEKIVEEETPSSRKSTRVDPSIRTALRKEVSTSKFTHVGADGTLPHYLPERRIRLVNSMRAFGQPKVDELKTRLSGEVTINVDLCRSCRCCTVFCPTGALQRVDLSDGGFGVDFRSTKCVQCGLCEAICLEEAITISDTISLKDFVSGKPMRFAMKPLGWQPGGPESIPTRMARMFKTTAVQDPQVVLNESQVAKLQAYDHQRAEERRRIRG